MEFIDNLNSLANKIITRGSLVSTEEATKQAFIVPFITGVLGYDVSDPTEVTPEYSCDVGTKKGEKVDYAIMKDGVIQILIECKKIGDPLNLNHASQLYRYFGTSKARISILTNGHIYKFFTDLDAPNKMDEKPFLELDLLNIDEYLVTELQKLTKPSFDLDSIINSAGELKYVSQIKKLVSEQFVKPDESFVKLFAARVYDGRLTQSITEQFGVLTQKALAQFMNDQANERLKSAIQSIPIVNEIQKDQLAVNTNVVTTEDKIEVTLEELESYHIVKAIVRSETEVSRITHRSAQTYFSILLDDNNRKPICRLNVNRTKKYITIFSKDNPETKNAISSIDDIYLFSEQLKETVKLLK